MKRFTMFACLALALVFALSSSAGELPRYVKANGNEVIHGGGVGTFKAASRDTNVLIGPNGSGAQAIGTFEDNGGNANWNGWTSVDITQPTVAKWHADTYYALNGTYSAWCGEDIPSCGGGDPAGGYANNYNELLEWRGAVTSSGLSCTVTVSYTLAYDTEPGFDYAILSYETFNDGIVDVVSWSGRDTVAVSEVISYAPGDYMGVGSNEVVILFRATADGGWSDSDCAWPSHGACQIDDVSISGTNGLPTYNENFESGTLGSLTVRFPIGVGNYAKIWSGLEDVDPCHTNYSAQAAFIDDGVVVPGTGGSDCVNWCYGPQGYIVNTEGGLAGPSAHINNAIESPIVNWVDQNNNGCSFVFDAYRHEDLSADAPGIFYTWGIRSATAGNDITGAGWLDRNFVYYGDPLYIRAGDGACGDLLEPERTQVQVQMAAFELGWVWGYVGNDGYPAPYFDNVRLIEYPIVGPAMSGREIDFAQDNFPEIGLIDLGTPGANHVRFDMANNISPNSHNRNDPGDSVVFQAVVVRSGASMTGLPRMYYKLFPNPVFDPYRTSGLPNQGFVLCDSVRNAAGLVVADKWYADLPDTGFFYPGDIIHYYLWSEDALAGGASPEVGLMPADTTGFSFVDPHNALNYNSSFTVRALPTIADLSGTQPEVLFWNDFANRGGQAEWHGAFNNLGLLAGRDYDVYYTNGPSSGVGDGLGGRATSLVIDGYTDMLYTAGDLGVNTIANGDYNNDPSFDAEVLDLWLRNAPVGETRDLFATGDDFMSDMAQSGAVTSALLSDQFGVSVASDDLRPLISSQAAPLVLKETGNSVFTGSDFNTWIAYGGCNAINTFDAVIPLSGAERLAQFANASGAPGGWSYSAATLNEPAWGARVISLPYDFMFVYTDPDEVTAKADAIVSARVRMLNYVLTYFGIATHPGDVSPVPNADAFAMSNFPNPFNPKTTISYTVPKTGEFSLKIFNIRGELVKTLIDGSVAAGQASIDWDGSNNQGGKVPSGVYFSQARFGSDVITNKMALVK